MSPLLTTPLPGGNHGLRFIPITPPMQGPFCCLGRCCLILDGEEEEGSVCAYRAGMEGEMVPSRTRCCISCLGVVVPGCQGLYRTPHCPPENKGIRMALLSWGLHRGLSLLRASPSISTAGCPAGGHSSISVCPMDTFCSTAAPPPHSVPLDGGSSVTLCCESCLWGKREKMWILEENIGGKQGRAPLHREASGLRYLPAFPPLRLAPGCSSSQLCDEPGQVLPTSPTSSKATKPRSTLLLQYCLVK